MLVVSQRWKDELSLAYETALQIIMKKVVGMTDKKLEQQFTNLSLAHCCRIVTPDNSNLQGTNEMVRDSESLSYQGHLNMNVLGKGNAISV